MQDALGMILVAPQLNLDADGVARSPYARDAEQATAGLYALSDSRSTLRASDLIITSQFLSGPH